VVAIAVIRVLYPDLTPDEAVEVMLPHAEQARLSSRWQREGDSAIDR
jgi:hypothetical protein